MEILHRAKKGSCSWQNITRKGTNIIAITDASCLPVAAHIESASPHEVKLVEATLDSRFIDKAPVKLIGDKAYDRAKLDKIFLKVMALK